MKALVQLWSRVPLGLRELVLYGMASAAALSVDWGLLLVLTGAGVAYLPAAAASFLAGMVVTYTASVRLVFKHRAVVDKRREFAGFLGVGLLGLVLTQLLMALWVERAGLVPAIAKAPTAVMVFVFNFTVRRALLFRAPHVS